MVTTYYHSWGFLCMSLGHCQPLFQELLLLLQPLSVLPFDLNLLLEHRLLSSRQLCSDQEGVSPPPPPCSALLVTSWPLLQADVRPEQQARLSQQHPGSQSSCEGPQLDRNPFLAPIPEWWPNESDLEDGVVEGEDCGQNNADNWSQISMDSRQEERRGESSSSSGTPNASSPCQGWLRWAKLFGAADTSSKVEAVSQSHSGAHTKRWFDFDAAHSHISAFLKSLYSRLIVPQEQATVTVAAPGQVSAGTAGSIHQVDEAGRSRDGQELLNKKTYFL